MGYLSSLPSLANLSPHRGLLFWGGEVGVGGGVTQAMMDGKTAIGSSTQSHKDVAPAHNHVSVCFYSFFTRTRPTAAGPTLDGVQLSGMQIC